MTIDPEFSFENRDGGGDVGMELCQVTGKLVAKDEIVELHGYRVCAEGKQELMRRMRAGEALPGELETPRIMVRFVALFLDGTLISICFLIAGMAIGVDFLGLSALQASEPAYFRPGNRGVKTLVTLFGGLVYFTYFHGRWGQTLGKMATGLKVVEFDGSPISYRKAAVRWLFLDGVKIMAPIAILSLDDAENTMKIMVIFASVVGLWKTADVILALTDRDEQKSLHDRLASTRVVVQQ
ncbi:MAG: RDD family protein [Nitrospinota bacterium]|nr:RDD family protein [Nitrospinota bacterium]